jgi:hypothetical protein
MSVASFRNQSGQANRCGDFTVRKFDANVWKAASFFSMASTPCHPPIARPKENPPHPANRSINVGFGGIGGAELAEVAMIGAQKPRVNANIRVLFVVAGKGVLH